MPAISLSRSSVLLRLTSVGCAVRTGLTSASAKKPRSLATSKPASSQRRNMSASVPRLGGESARAWGRVGRRVTQSRDPCATDVMLILGDFGKVREPAESGDDLGPLIVGEGIEDPLD